MPINSSTDSEYIFQQTFMGASITSFNASMGFNSNSNSININLVEDNKNKREPNAVDEGYHIWDKKKGFPEGAAKNYKAAGDVFYAPTVGSPAYFEYYKSTIRSCGACGTTREGRDEEGDRIQIFTEESPRVNKDQESCEAAGKVWKKPAVVDKRKAAKKGDLSKVYEFNGIVKNYKRGTSSRGVTYTVTLEDPRFMLEGTQVVLGGHSDPIATADASYNIIRKFRNGKYSNRRYYKFGAIGYYNILNPFGYYEYFQYGSADVSANGMPWVKVLDALATILKGRYDIWEDEDGEVYNLERFGGPLYYVQDLRKEQEMKASEPVNVHRYQVDLRDMYLLHKDKGGPLGDDIRINGESMSLLSLLQKICEIAGADFFVELVTKKDNGKTPIAEKKQHEQSDYAGVIKVTPILRNAPIVPGLIQKEIDTATEQSQLTEQEDSDCTKGEAKHRWAKRIVSHNIGYEFKDPVSGIVLTGAQRTRVVGVTAMGWFPDINVQGEEGGGMIRKRFAVGSDKLREFMPSIEQDGVAFCNPGWLHPKGFPDNTRGISVDPANPITKAMWNVKNPLSPVSNDDFVSWGHDKTPFMEAKLHKLADAVGTPPEFQLAGIKAGDGLIDLYPCWGFLRGSDQFKGVFTASSYLAPKAKGVPIKGRFGNDNAYRDFDTLRGIFSIFEYYDYDYKTKSLEKPGPCFFTPYSNQCPAYPEPKGGIQAPACYENDGANAKEKEVKDDKGVVQKGKKYNNKEDCEKNDGFWYSRGGDFVTYRYKLTSKTFDTRQRIRVKDTETGGTKLVDNPNYGNLASFTFAQPATADIPVDLSNLIGGISYTGGPVTKYGDFSHYYYATVTELRAALSGFQSWSEYTQIFAPWLHCTLGLPTCPMATGKQANMAGGQKEAPFIVVKDADGNEKKVPKWKGAGPFVYPVVHAFNRWLGIVPPLSGDEDHDGRVDNYTLESMKEVPGAQENSSKLLEAVFDRIQQTASHYGKSYLMALPFTPPESDEHIRQISEVAFEYEQRWDISSEGWVDIDTQTKEFGKRYPHNINFYSSEGNLEPFVVFPQYRQQTISKRQAPIDPGSQDPKSVHYTFIEDSLGGGSQGKIFKKTNVDQTTYWLWSTSTYDIQTGKAKEGTIKPYALIKQSERASLRHDDMTSVSPNSSTRRRQDKTWAIKPFGVPLGKINGRYLFNANFIYGFKTGLYHQGSTHAGAWQDSGKFTLAPAAYAPWTAAVPQKSNRYRWGPWALGTGFGKAKYEVDTNFHPAAFGGFDNMEIAGIEKCKAAVEPDQVTSGWAKESGSITLAGLPSADDGDGRSIMGRQLMGQGPYITDVSLDIGSGGVTTTYNMQTQRKFGKLQEIYENRMRQQASDIIKTAKELNDLRG